MRLGTLAHWPRIIVLFAGSATFALWFLSTGPVSAGGYGQVISNAVMNHDRIAAARADVEAARQRARASIGSWFPQLNTIANYGREQQLKPSPTPSTNADFNRVDIKITQLLWDFGASNAGIEKTRLQFVRAQIALFQTIQDVTLEAVNAVIGFQRAVEVEKYARQSEDNIRRQTGLEQARVEAGGGLSTDVLQSKTQLAGAQVRRIQAEGALVQARNRYQAVYHQSPHSIGKLGSMDLVKARLPKSLQQAIGIALRQNPRIRLASMDEAVAVQNIHQVASGEFFPRLNAVGQHTYNDNVDGILGRQHNTLIKAELTFPFNLGFTSINTLRASESDLVAASGRVLDTRRLLEETVQNAWQQYETAKLSVHALHDQASLAQAFLELAREERKLGKRSLIDVLSGETALYNALADAAAKEADVELAAFALLHATGQLAPPDQLTDVPAKR